MALDWPGSGIEKECHKYLSSVEIIPHNEADKCFGASFRHDLAITEYSIDNEKEIDLTPVKFTKDGIYFKPLFDEVTAKLILGKENL